MRHSAGKPIRRDAAKRLLALKFGSAALLLLAFSALVIAQSVARAQPAPSYAPSSGLPSFRLLQQSATVTPATAQTYYGTPASPAAAPRGARIVQLARALNDTNSPSEATLENIYQFVLNGFDFDPQFGLHKGAEGLWLDGAGGAFDHANLMVDLAREAGFSARYVLGEVQLDNTEATAALRVLSGRQACELLALSGTPATVNGQTNCASIAGAVTNVTMLHVWVEVLVGSTWKTFDPSLKRYDRVFPL